MCVCTRACSRCRCGCGCSCGCGYACVCACARVHVCYVTRVCALLRTALWGRRRSSQGGFRSAQPSKQRRWRWLRLVMLCIGVVHADTLPDTGSYCTDRSETDMVSLLLAAGEDGSVKMGGGIAAVATTCQSFDHPFSLASISEAMSAHPPSVCLCQSLVQVSAAPM